MDKKCHSEKDFIIPVLKTIQENNGACTTSFIKKNISKHIDLNEKDLEPFPSRNKEEPRYYQVVGNLISHRNQTLFSYINSIETLDQSKIKQKAWELNEDGIEFLSGLKDDTQQIIAPSNSANNYQENLFELDELNQKTLDFISSGSTKRPPINRSIGKTVIEMMEYKCEYAMYTGVDHNTFKNSSGEHNFMEAHHLIPIKATRDFFPFNLDRPSNIVSLCPNCHALLHSGSKEEVEKVLHVIFDKHIDCLNKDGIYITFENLFNKYYL